MFIEKRQTQTHILGNSGVELMFACKIKLIFDKILPVRKRQRILNCFEKILK